MRLMYPPCMTSKHLRIGTLGVKHWIWEHIRLGALRELRRHQVRVIEMSSEADLERQTPSLDGVIAHVSSPSLRSKLQELRGIIVNTSAIMQTPEFYQVIPDNVEVGRKSAAHLHALGCSDFLYLSHHLVQFSLDRETGFRDECNQRHAQSVHEFIWRKNTAIPTALQKILKTSGDSLGVMTCDDGEAIRLLDSIREDSSLPIVPVISGHDHGTPYDPMITGVGLQETLWGETAAKVMLHALKEKPPPSITLVPPSEINLKGSTSSFQVRDPHLRKAMAFIQDHACDFIRVEDVVQAAGLSRRPLELRMRNERNQTLLEAIHDRQIQEAKRYLRETNEPMTEVAFMSGMSGEPQLRRLFKRYGETSPGQQRKLSQRT